MDRVGTAGLLGLVPYFRAAGFDCRVPDYGLITAGETKIANPLIVRSLRPYMEPGDLFVGHSNGCAIGYELSQGGAQFAGCIWINPALQRDRRPATPSWADVYWNAGDDATVAAVPAQALGLVDSNWGDMGHAGPDFDPSGLVVGLDAGDMPTMPAVSGHSEIFAEASLDRWGPYILERAKTRLR